MLKGMTTGSFAWRVVGVTAFVFTYLWAAPLTASLDAGSRAQASILQCSNRVTDASGGGVTRKAVILSKPEAEMTQSARRNKVEGVVVLSIVLNASGRVTDITTVEGLPDGLTEAATRAAEQIRFEPALKDGCPVSQRLKVQYEFRS